MKMGNGQQQATTLIRDWLEAHSASQVAAFIILFSCLVSLFYIHLLCATVHGECLGVEATALYGERVCLASGSCSNGTRCRSKSAQAGISHQLTKITIM